MIRTAWKGLKWLLLLLVAYLLCLVLIMPVGWLVPQLSLPRQLTLSGLSGTLWQGGAASVVFAQRGSQPLELTQLNWQFDGSRLLRGDLAWQLRAQGDLNIRGLAGVSLGFSGVKVFAEQALIDAPAADLLSKFQLPVPVSVEGDLSLNLRSYRHGLSGSGFTAGWCEELSGDLWWQGAAGSSFGQGLALGDINAQLDCLEGGALQAIVSAEGGQILPELEASLQPDGQAAVDGFLVPGENMPSNIRSLMGMMGRPDSQGRWPVRLRQRLL